MNDYRMNSDYAFLVLVGSGWKGGLNTPAPGGSAELQHQPAAKAATAWEPAMGHIANKANNNTTNNDNKYSNNNDNNNNNTTATTTTTTTTSAQQHQQTMTTATTTTSTSAQQHRQYKLRQQPPLLQNNRNNINRTSNGNNYRSNIISACASLKSPTSGTHPFSTAIYIHYAHVAVNFVVGIWRHCMRVELDMAAEPTFSDS